MRVFRVTFNLPGSKFPTDVRLEEEKLKSLMSAMDRGAKVVELDGSYFNTAYFIQAVPDSEAIELRVVQDKLVEKGVLDSPETIQKRIEMTQMKHELQSKMLVNPIRDLGEKHYS